MDALIIGPASELAGAVAGGLRRQGRSVLQALPADASDGERIEWLLDEAGRPGLVVMLGRAGRRWFTVGSKRAETMSAQRAAAVVLRACRLPAPALAVS
jgi:hypothetical protein